MPSRSRFQWSLLGVVTAALVVAVSWWLSTRPDSGRVPVVIGDEGDASAASAPRRQEPEGAIASRPFVREPGPEEPPAPAAPPDHSDQWILFGRVHEASGSGIGQAELIVKAPKARATAMTDDAGDYRTAFSAPRVTAASVRCASAVHRFFTGLPARPASGTQQRWDLILPEATTVRGRVETVGQQPVAGAVLRYVALNDFDLVTARIDSPADAHGRFEIKLRGRGHGHVSVLPHGELFATSDPTDVRLDGKVHDVGVLRLAATGTVRIELAHARTGAPVTDATAKVFCPARQSMIESEPTDARGRTRITFPAGRRDFLLQEVSCHRFVGEAHVPVDLRPGGHATARFRVLPTAEALGGPGAQGHGSFRVVIADSANTPLSGVTVTWGPFQREDIEGEVEIPIRTERETHDLVVTHPDHRPYRARSWAPRSGQEHQVRLEARRVMRIRPVVPDGGDLAGVTCDYAQTTAGGSSFELRGNPWLPRIDADVLSVPIPSGAQDTHVLITLPGRAWGVLRLHAAPIDQPPQRFALERLVEKRGRVLDAAGRPVPGTVVYASSQDLRIDTTLRQSSAGRGCLDRAVADPSGAFSIHLPQNGGHLLALTDRAAKLLAPVPAGSLDVRLAPAIDVEVRCPRPLSVAGRVVAHHETAVVKFRSDTVWPLGTSSLPMRLPFAGLYRLSVYGLPGREHRALNTTIDTRARTVIALSP